MNSDLSDIADAITDSLARNGEGGMTAAIPLSVNGWFYSADPDTGGSRTAANTQVITVGGEDWTFTEDALTAPDGSDVGPLIGEMKMWMGATAPSGWVLLQGQACTTSYPLQRAFLIAEGSPYGTSGGDPLFPDMRCVVPVGQDTSRGILTGSAVLGALLGEQSRTLVTGNLPAYTPGGAVNITDTRTWQTNNPIHPSAGTPFGLGAGANLGLPAVQPVGVASGSISAGFTGNAQGGTSTAFGIVQPTVVVNYIGRAA